MDRRDILGASAAFTALASKAQHCRAEFFDARFGWIPVDPADARKMVLEEEGRIIPIDYPKVLESRGKLFGYWPMNWVSFNTAGDWQLPVVGDSLNFFMYPDAQTAAGKPDSLEPQSFRYKMTSREIIA